MSRPAPPERLLTLQEAAQLTTTTERLWRRLIAERRIRYVKVGRYVRVPESAVAEFVEEHTVLPAPGPAGTSAARPVGRGTRPDLRPLSRRSGGDTRIRYLGRDGTA